MSTPLDRIREAVDKAEAGRKVGRDPDPDTHFYAAVQAGDVAEVVKGVGNRADATAKELAKGVENLPPTLIVYQRADQLRAVCDMAPALTAVPDAGREINIAVPVPPLLSAEPAPAETPAAPTPPDAATRRKFNPSGK